MNKRKLLLAKSILPSSLIYQANDCNWTRTQNHLLLKRTLNHLAKLAKWLSCVLSKICTVHLTVCSSHVTYAFESESTHYGCLNVKELLARSSREIWRWSDCNWTNAIKNIKIYFWSCRNILLRAVSKPQQIF